VVQRRQIRRRRQVEAALRAGQRRLHDILGTTTAVVFLVDLDWRFMLVNREWEKATGMPRSPVVEVARQIAP
jgi:PAS domain-containing protein